MKNKETKEKKKFTILGMTIWKLLAYFIIYSVLGYLIETLFGLVTKGVIESRKSFIYGPFCAIYGVGAVIMIGSLRHFKKNNFTLFFGGFLIGSALAYKLNCGFIPVRKKGKLPYKTISEEYALEYGTDTLYMHEDAIKKGERVLIVDDLIATGGTALAMIKMVERLEGIVVGSSFLIELKELNGRKEIEKYPVNVLIQY